MENPCYRCQASIEEGIAFCPHCGAPQIRVVAPEDSTSPVPGGEIPPPFQPAPPPSQWPQSIAQYAPQASVVRWELAWKGALLAGLGAALLTSIPFVSLGCCLWLLGAGALAVFLYQKRMSGTLITPAMGMKVGALGGVFAFIIHGTVTAITFVTFRGSTDFRRVLQEQMDRQIAATPDPKAQEIMRNMAEWMSTPQGTATIIVTIIVIMAVFFVVFTAAGGALGASMFGKRREFR